MRSTPLLSVEVSASTSNLGPGFDFLGLCVALFLRVEVRARAAAGTHTFVELTGTASEWPSTASNLFLRAFERTQRFLDEEVTAWDFAVHSDIPIARGLGSSGAACAAGILLASALASRATTLEERLALGLELEGHPDNVCAALVGGCTLSVPVEGGRVRVVRQPLASSLAYGIAWPEQRLVTSVARSVLPTSVPFADAVENPRRLALLLEGLRTGDPELLALGSVDRLHVHARLPLIPGGERALNAARESGAHLATISGSGSALFAIMPRARAAIVTEAMRAELAREGSATGRVVEAVTTEPVVVRTRG